jgi:hypothetical protein
VTLRNILAALAALTLTAAAHAIELPAQDLDPAFPPQFSIHATRLYLIAPRLLVGEVTGGISEIGLHRRMRTQFPGAFVEGEAVRVRLEDGRAVTVGTLGDEVEVESGLPARLVVLAPGVTLEGGHGGVALDVSER